MSFPKVYTVNGPSSTSSSTLPSWLTIKPRASNHRKRVRTQRQLGQLELIQDFAFPESAIRIRTTPDGHYAIGTGSYKPMMKVWDLAQLTVKFERVTDAENVDFVILSSDWTKTLHLQRDRSLALHTQMGLHHTLRLPTYGRSLAYHPPTADALVACTGPEVYRFNLEEGRFMTPISLGHGLEDVEGVNVVDVNSRHGLWSFGLDGGGGAVELWDPRSRSALTRLTLPVSTLLPAQSYDAPSILAQPVPKLSITSLASHPTDGLSLAVGTSSGHTLLYDLRSPTPFAVKDQGYGEPIITVDWLRGGGAQEDGGRVVSADSKVIKIWGKEDPSTNHLSLHPPSPLVHLHSVPQSGLLFVACNAAPLSSYYIPEIGPAPRWASFLDSVTEELADDPTGGAGKGAYTDFKFVDKFELDTLGLPHLIGTPALKPYMHGYFLSLKLYATARLITNPQSYAEYRDRVVSERVAAKAESRIRARKDQPKVNKALAERIRRSEKKDGKDGGVMEDSRFKEVFENPDYEVDEESREFALLNPATANNNAKRKTAAQEEDEESDRSSSGIGESESGSEPEAEGNSDDSGDGNLRQYDPRTVLPSQRSNSILPPAATSRPRPRLIVGSGDTAPRPRQETFGSRLQSRPNKGKLSSRPQEDDGVLATRRSADGGMEMSFIPQKSQSGSPGGQDENDEYSGGTRRKDRKIERFGAGMEKGQEEEVVERGGRTRRRDVGRGRSASKNAFRRR